MAAAAVIFFAFYGFDAVSTAAEEAKNPATRSQDRDRRLDDCVHDHIHGSRSGSDGWRELRGACREPEPLSMVLRNLNHPLAATLIAGAAVVALPTVIMAFMYGQSRVFFVMARDGLLPQRLAP